MKPLPLAVNWSLSHLRSGASRSAGSVRTSWHAQQQEWQQPQLGALQLLAARLAVEAAACSCWLLAWLLRLLRLPPQLLTFPG